MSAPKDLIDNPADGLVGIAWWNGLTEHQRAEALRAAESTCPADAWNHWRYGFACEENAHG